MKPLFLENLSIADIEEIAVHVRVIQILEDGQEVFFERTWLSEVSIVIVSSRNDNGNGY